MGIFTMQDRIIAAKEKPWGYPLAKKGGSIYIPPPLAFDGEDDYLRLTGGAWGAPCSYEFLLGVGRVQPGTLLMSHGTKTSSGGVFWFNLNSQGNLEVGVRDYPVIIIPTPEDRLHIVCSFNANSLSIYVNGVFFVEEARALNVPSSSYMAIGGYLNYEGTLIVVAPVDFYYFRFWEKALAEDEIYRGGGIVEGVSSFFDAATVNDNKIIDPVSSVEATVYGR